MQNEKYISRLVDTEIEEILLSSGAVCIQGPKWCGKTWTGINHANSSYFVGDPINSFSNRRVAIMDPFLTLNGDVPHLIDEWQEVPQIWDAVRMEVDRRGSFGQFILTGSSTPNRKGTMHSGTGRISKVRMHTMSLYESGESDGSVSIKDLFDNKFDNHFIHEVSLMDLIELTIRGGWPQALKVSNSERIARDYITAFLEEDLPRLDDRSFRDINKFRYLMMSLARNESTTSSINSIIGDLKASVAINTTAETVNEYINILESAFLIENQRYFSVNARSSKRIKNAPKRHFCDPSLSCALLSLTKDKLLHDLETFGFMFEALVERDLRIYAQSLDACLSHYQDYGSNEIDAVIELRDGRWGAFEIKLGYNQVDKAASNLLKIKASFENIDKSGGPTFLAVICGMSNVAYRRPDGVYVLPLLSLKP